MIIGDKLNERQMLISLFEASKPKLCNLEETHLWCYTQTFCFLEKSVAKRNLSWENKKYVYITSG